MRAITLYLHIHQPYRYRRYSAFDSDHRYWDDSWQSNQNNERIFKKVAEKSYHPMLDLIERNLARHPGFKISLSITGTWLEQAEAWDPSLIAQIRRLVRTGRTEIIGETYYHSLSFFYNLEEFEDQVRLHRRRIYELFGVTPRVFRNTELAYSDDLARWADAFGFRGILAEGWDKVLAGKSPNYVYRPKDTKNLRLLLKNYRLSDDIAFRFSDQNWPAWPLTVEKYQNWVDMDCLRGPLVNLFMDFETFGEHQWADTGIFDFMDTFIARWLSFYDNHFLTASEACNVMTPAGEISMPQVVTWADTERDLSAWLGNSMQTEAEKALYSLRPAILASNDPTLIRDFRLLTTSDHAYYMCTKYWNDGDVHAYFSAYESPYDAFICFMNLIRDLKYRLDKISNL